MIEEIREMEERETSFRNKGGRPPKAVKKHYLLALKCSLLERATIRSRAKKVNLTVSEYLRQMALTGKVEMKNKVLPNEVLLLTATLLHIRACLNPIAKKRSSNDELTDAERATLMGLAVELEPIPQQIKDYLK